MSTSSLETELFLPGNAARARWKRLDTAQILKRFFFCERAVILGTSVWVPQISDLEVKLGLPHFNWQNAETAQSLRHRVFELRYPSRLLEQEGADRPLADGLRQLDHAPNTGAFLRGLGEVAYPAIRSAYQEFLKLADPLADAPTYRFLELALVEKDRQVDTVKRWAAQHLARNPHERTEADVWVGALSEQIRSLGGVGTDKPPVERDGLALPGSRPLVAPESPARDTAYWRCRFYWPDIIDPSFPYGDGLRLQLRSAVSHLNEAWAVEHGAMALAAFAEMLPWEWVYDATRWTYDESRHCRMGELRLRAWGFSPEEIPFGDYIYRSANGGEMIDRLGMLYFFETKNIGRKPERTAAFKRIGDAASEHDMDFDWADETIHAGYGNRWLRELHTLDPNNFPAPDEVRRRCEERVGREVGTVTEEEGTAIRHRAAGMIARAVELARRV